MFRSGLYYDIYRHDFRVVIPSDMSDAVDAHAVGLCVATIATEAERAEMALDFPL